MSKELQPQRLGIADIAELTLLDREIAAASPTGFLRPKSDEDLRAIVAGKTGAAFGIRRNGELVAAALISYPGPLPTGAPRFPRVPTAEWSTRAAFFDGAVVLPELRGRGLQRALLDARLAYARAEGRRWRCAGVHAANIPSWRNLLKKGFAIVGIAYFHGYPLFGLLQSEDEAALAAAGHDHLVEAGNVEAHERALAAGMLGIGLAEGAVAYRRALHPDTVGRPVVRELA